MFIGPLAIQASDTYITIGKLLNRIVITAIDTVVVITFVDIFVTGIKFYIVVIVVVVRFMT
jgi:hypothetical protein